jgi:hypothetical protein
VDVVFGVEAGQAAQEAPRHNQEEASDDQTGHDKKLFGSMLTLYFGRAGVLAVVASHRERCLVSCFHNRTLVVVEIVDSFGNISMNLVHLIVDSFFRLYRFRLR